MINNTLGEASLTNLLQEGDSEFLLDIKASRMGWLPCCFATRLPFSKRTGLLGAKSLITHRIHAGFQLVAAYDSKKFIELRLSPAIHSSKRGLNK